MSTPIFSAIARERRLVRMTDGTLEELPPYESRRDRATNRVLAVLCGVLLALIGLDAILQAVAS